MHHGRYIQLLQVRILLAHPHVQNWLRCGVHQRQGSAHLVVHCIEF